MGGNTLRLIGIETERKTTKELHKIFNELKYYFSDYDIFMTKCYKEKPTHGDLDILLKTNNIKEIKNLISNDINPKGIYVNDTVITFDYNNFQIDIICINPNDWIMSKVYYSYDPMGNLMGKIANYLGLKYGKDGLYFKSIGKITNEKIFLSKNPKEIFEFFGYDFEIFKNGFNSKIDIFNYIINGKFFDKEIFNPINLTNSDRKRSLKRDTFREFLFYIKNKKSNLIDIDYNDYINEWFPNLKKDISLHLEKDEKKQNINKKIRTVFNKFEPNKELGNVIKSYKNSKNDYNLFINDNDEKFLIDDFEEFRNHYLNIKN
jgi:hypothetical protein